MTQVIGIIEARLKEDERWFENPWEIKKYKALEGQRNKLLQIEEIIWRQKSRAVWLKHGIEVQFFFKVKLIKEE